MENQSDRIQDYIDGHMDANDLARFEGQLAMDDELKDQVVRQQEINRILIKRAASEEAGLRDTLTQVSHGFRGEKRGIIVRMKNYIAVATAACILIFGGLLLLDRKNDLYTLPEMQSEIVRGQEQNLVYEEAVAAFNEKEYRIARGGFESLLKDNPSQVQVQYYLGLSYIGEEDWKSAISTLSPVADGTSVFGKEAQFYLAVSYYKNGEDRKAIVLLEQLCEESEEWCDKTKRLLNKLK